MKHGIRCATLSDDWVGIYAAKDYHFGRASKKAIRRDLWIKKWTTKTIAFEYEFETWFIVLEIANWVPK